MKTKHQARRQPSKDGSSTQSKKRPLAIVGARHRKPPGPSFLTDAAACSLMRFRKRILPLTILAASDEIDKVLPLISHHPRLKEEVAFLGEIYHGRARLALLASQGDEWDWMRRKSGEYFDEAHEDAAFRLFSAFLEPIRELPLIQFSNELEGIADLIEHNPHLKREVGAMRRIVDGIGRLDGLEFTDEHCGPPNATQAVEQRRSR